MADAETDVLAVRDFVVLYIFHMEVAEFGLTHIVAPPQARMVDMDFCGEDESALLTSRKCHRTTERLSVSSTFDFTFHRLIREIFQFGDYCEPSFIKRFRVYPRSDCRMGYSHVATGLHPHLAIDAHTLIGRPWVPVHKTDIGLSGLGTEYLDSKHILLSDGFGHIKLKLPERTSHLLTVGNLLAVEPHISAIADPVEVE